MFTNLMEISIWRIQEALPNGPDETYVSQLPYNSDDITRKRPEFIARFAAGESRPRISR